MAEVSKQSERNHILPVFVEWKVINFRGIKEDDSDNNFMADKNFVLKVRRSRVNTYYFSIRLSELNTSIKTVNCKFSLIDQCGQHGFTVNRKITFHVPLSYELITVMTLDDVISFLTEGALSIRCKLFVEECPDSDNRSTQTDVLLFPGPPIKHLEKLSSDFERIYKDQADTDCILKTTDGKFPAHRAILSARSKVFAAMFHHETSERQTGEVNIEDVEGTILSDLIHYIYTGQVIGLSSDTAVRLYAAADKYALHELRDACARFLSCNLTIENICDAALLARTHAEDALERKVVSFIVDRFDEITESEEWKNLLEGNSFIASKYLTAAFKVAVKR